MGVILPVTVDTAAVCAAELMILVTGTAAGDCMHPLQGEESQFVIKTRRLFPIRGTVAERTIFKPGRAVYIIPGVAVTAVTRQFFLKGTAVALQAGQALVPTEKGPLGFSAMIE